MKWDPISHHIKKLNQMEEDLNVTKKTVILLEENMGIIYYFWFGNGFLDMPPKAQATKIHKLNSMKNYQKNPSLY